MLGLNVRTSLDGTGEATRNEGYSCNGELDDPRWSDSTAQIWNERRTFSCLFYRLDSAMVREKHENQRIQYSSNKLTMLTILKKYENLRTMDDRKSSDRVLVCLVKRHCKKVVGERAGVLDRLL